MGGINIREIVQGSRGGPKKTPTYVSGDSVSADEPKEVQKSEDKNKDEETDR